MNQTERKIRVEQAKRQASPKRANMDGDSYLAWLWKVEREIQRCRPGGYIRKDEADWAMAAFNTNTDPVAAAVEWLEVAGEELSRDRMARDYKDQIVIRRFAERLEDEPFRGEPGGPTVAGKPTR